MVVTGHDHQLVIGPLHNMCIAKRHYRVHALGQGGRGRPEEFLRWVCVQHDDQKATISIISFGI